MEGDEVSASPYINTSGFSDNNFLSNGFVFNLVLIFPPPFHQQKRKKIALLGTGYLVLVTFTLLQDICLILAKQADFSLNSQAPLPLKFLASVVDLPLPEIGLEADAG